VWVWRCCNGVGFFTSATTVAYCIIHSVESTYTKCATQISSNFAQELETLAKDSKPGFSFLAIYRQRATQIPHMRFDMKEFFKKEKKEIA
jgi:hypothetical protein